MYMSLQYWFQHLTPTVAILALSLAVRVPSAQAVGPAANTPTDLGAIFVTVPQGLFVRQLTSSTPYAGLRFADHITAINGRRVETEAAFLNHLALSRGSVITVVRNGRVQTLNASPTTSITTTRPGGGIINPSDFVRTSRGVMHKDAARRLGLSGTPIDGTPEP